MSEEETSHAATEVCLVCGGPAQAEVFASKGRQFHGLCWQCQHKWKHLWLRWHLRYPRLFTYFIRSIGGIPPEDIAARGVLGIQEPNPLDGVLDAIELDEFQPFVWADGVGQQPFPWKAEIVVLKKQGEKE